MNNSLFIDVSCSQIWKTDQNTCGDVFLSKRFPEERRVIAVLSDGLGSGIKANILGQMTATMLLRYVEEGRDIEKAAEVIMDSLPVCRVRKISYSTFTVVDCHENGSVTIVEEGNPGFLWMRGGMHLEAEAEIICSKKFSDRKMHRYQIRMLPDDRLIFCSDGVTQAGLGSPELRDGWQRSGLIDFTKAALLKHPEMPSQDLAKRISLTASHKCIENFVKDDTSTAVLHVRRPRMLLIFTGPPYHKERDSEHCQRFIQFNGQKAVCGGTTANIVSRELEKEVTTTTARGGLPGISQMEGIDLVTEGILTLTRLLEYLENAPPRETQDAAARLYELIMGNDCISFIVGAKMNQAYYDPEWPVELEIRKNIIRRIAGILESRQLKKVDIEFV